MSDTSDAQGQGVVEDKRDHSSLGRPTGMQLPSTCAQRCDELIYGRLPWMLLILHMEQAKLDSAACCVRGDGVWLSETAVAHVPIGSCVICVACRCLEPVCLEGHRVMQLSCAGLLAANSCARLSRVSCRYHHGVRLGRVGRLPKRGGWRDAEGTPPQPFSIVEREHQLATTSCDETVPRCRAVGRRSIVNCE